MKKLSFYSIIVFMMPIALLLMADCSKSSRVSIITLNPPSPPTDVKVSLSLRPEGPIYYLSWKDNSKNEDGFKIMGREREQSDYKEIGSVKKDETQFFDNSSPIDKTFYYRINAINSEGESASRGEGIRLGYLSKIEKNNIVDYDLYGTVLFVLWGDGISSFDVSNGKAPKLKNTLPLKGSVRSGNLRIDNLNAYVIDDDKLFIFNIKNPYDPAFVSSLDLAVNSMDMDFSRHAVYVLGENNVLYVISVKYPKRPALIKYFKLEGSPRNIAVSGNYLFMASARDGILIYDISNPLNPKALKTFEPPTPRFYNAISAFGSNLIASVRDFENEIHIIDFSDINNINVTTSIPINWIPLKIAASQNTLLAPESEGGIEILRGSDFSRMKIVASIDPEIDKAKIWTTMIAMSYQNGLYLFSVP